jgi:hypothetical protein
MTSDNASPNDDTIIDINPEHIVDVSEVDVSEVNVSEAAAPVVAPAKNTTRRNGVLGAAALLIAAGAGGLLYKDVLSPYYPSDQVLALSEKIATLETSNTEMRDHMTSVERLAAQLKSDVDALESSDGNMASQLTVGETAQRAAADRLTAVENNMRVAQTALDDLAKRPIGTSANSGTAGADAALVTALQQRIDMLEKDVASLKANPVGGVSDVAQLSQSLADLKAKVTAGIGYAVELERIQRMVPAAAGLDVLAAHAALGIADAKGLAVELKALIPDLPKPIIPGPVAESDGWWAGLYRGLSDLITIRVEGDVDWPTAASAAVALADAGDLAQALEQLDAVEAAKPVGVQQWTDKATARLNAEAALKTVDEAVLRVIAAKG